MTLLLEAESILGTSKQQRRGLTYFQNDIFLGARYALNDLMGKEFIISLIKDMELSDEQIYNFMYSQRLNNEWRTSLSVRIIDAPQKGTIPLGLEALNNDGHVSFKLSRFF